MTADLAVIGSCNLDMVMRVRRLPAPGETVTGGVLTRSFGGKGANAAIAAARLGARVALVGAVGADADGAAIRADLWAAGVDAGGLADVDAPTGIAHITVDDRAENTIAVASGANALLTGEMVAACLDRLAGPGTLVMANLEVPDAAVLAAARWCRDAGCRLVVDPAPAHPLDPEVLAGCALLSPNRGELDGLDMTVGELLGAGVGHVVVTLGADGTELHAPGAPVRRAASFRVDAQDTTGAGDAFLAGLAVAWQRGASLPDAVRSGAAAGALASRALGARAALPTPAELEALLATGTAGVAGGPEASDQEG